MGPDNVQRVTEVTEMVSHFSNDSTEKWVNKILNNLNYERRIQAQKVRDAEYDFSFYATTITQIYEKELTNSLNEK